jgi:uncharacterized membrane protein (DUF2068 family)
MGTKGRQGKGKRGAGRHRRYDTSVRIVALFEAAKGGAVILAGMGLLALVHRNAQAVAEDVVRHLHFNPATRFPRIFLDTAAQVTDARLWALAMTALLYSTVRFVEAYGLWRQRIWAEWFAILSGAIYLPLEIYELTLSVSAVKAAILLVNLLVVGWLSWVRWQSRGKGASS